MSRRTILVVDDQPLNRELVADLLEPAGYTVLEAEDGVDLLERVQREHPDLILLDLKLPGPDGFTLARQLKAHPATRGVPVVAVTADLLPDKRAWALEAGCDGYLQKPLDPRELLEVVTRLLARGG
ncbi:MAG: response regulator [candidate division NC10 bacterium]|nr:response regulator [candidate division NC10 bacterium]